MHPSTRCWCGHSLSAHADRHRQHVGACRHVDSLSVQARHFDGPGDQLPRCPCTGFREEDDQINVGSLTSVLEGLHVSIDTILGRVEGRVERIDHHDGRTLITFTPQNGIERSVYFRDDLTCTIHLDWELDP